MEDGTNEPDASKFDTPGRSSSVPSSLEAASRAFSFPYPLAYSIQIELMQAVFRAIEDRKVGLFESPTGTGKSLSLICAAFTWLQMNRGRSLHTLASQADTVEPDWVLAHGAQKKREEATHYEDELNRRIAEVRRGWSAPDAKQRSRSKKLKTSTSVNDSDSGSDSCFLGDIDDSAAHGTWKLPEGDSAYLSPAVRALMDQVTESSQSNPFKPFYAKKKALGQDMEEDEEPETLPKIIYASRTHTQLSQFIAELKKTSFGKEISIQNIDADDSRKAGGPVRNISLGSRKQMCINASVQEVGKRIGMEAMNERCQTLMKGESDGKKQRCQYLPPATEEGQTRLLGYRDKAFTNVHDIEDLVKLGRELDTCPYFAARGSARQAQLVTLPYNLLLQANARASLNISFKDTIVVIDEAHNLIDTILSIHTISLTSNQVVQAQEQIRVYLQRFSMRLRGSNEVNLKKLLKLLENLSRQCRDSQKELESRFGKEGEDIITAAELVRRLGDNLDQVNLIELEAWLKETQIARKVAGYAEKQSVRQLASEGRLNIINMAKDTHVKSALAAMHTIEAFLLSLSNQNQDGRVLLSLSASGETANERHLMLKYQLLNPADVFAHIVDEARSIILAGGTMEPISDFTSQLFAKMDESRLVKFSCKHIIPSDNLMAAVVGKGPTGVDLEFKFNARHDNALLDELISCVVNYCNVIPHGVVVFLPSYAFLDALLARWKTSQGLQKVAAKKKIFYEPKLASQVDLVLQDYTTSASSTGALLFAVVGAKLSEGINFSDRLARAVLMVGMPFANSKSLELMERMKYVRALGDRTMTTTSAAKRDLGQELYVNLCMKAVNQSIGRAIRHQADYAALILLDRRYGRTDIRNRLPAWIRPSVNTYDSFGPSIAAVGNFFRQKKPKGTL